MAHCEGFQILTALSFSINDVECFLKQSLEINCVLKNNDINFTQQQKTNEIQTLISALSELQCDNFTRHFP